MEGSIRCDANYVPLTPISFLERSALVYSDRISIVYGDHVKFTWRQTYERCVKIASSLVTRFQISPGDVVAALGPNVPEMYELQFGIPMAGGVISCLNIRHDSAMISTLLKHSNAKVVFVDYQYVDLIKGAFEIMSSSSSTLPQLVLIPDSENGPSVSNGHEAGVTKYEDLLETGSLDFEIRRPKDECGPIALNYTSGTTSNPKGVIFSHRGAYLNTLAVALLNQMWSMPVYLWVVPMFHCNGWCIAWAMAAQGGTNICIRAVRAKGIFECISRHRVTHMGGAPTVLSMLANATDAERVPLPGKVMLMTGGSPPQPHVHIKMEQLGFIVLHVYGLTESSGVGAVCPWNPEWESLPSDAQLKMKSRQGVKHLVMEDLDVKDPVTMESVPRDAKTIGEVMFRGNTVMSGYLKDPIATQEAFKGGWLRSGDLGVRHPDGYIELKDRSKDIIISGGENINTIEVETVLSSHPGVLEAALVGRPDDYWGETPCAFVKLKEGFETSSGEIIEYCRKRLSHYMAPRTVVFEDLPKTSTGKTQKFILREKAKTMGSLFKGNNKPLENPLVV